MEIDANLVRRLLKAQFPQWCDLPLRPAPLSGWDNRTFRLGERMAVRLPSAQAYASQVEKEQRWLPVLARGLPFAVPSPLAMGQPGEGYPWHWSVYNWLEGSSARASHIADRRRFATKLAEFLRALQQIDTTGGPPPGAHNCYRGGPLDRYDAETRSAVAALGEQICGSDIICAWEASVAAKWHGPPVWLHGDLAPGNLLVSGGELSSVIDFGCCAIGDPACDLAVAWAFFRSDERSAFRAALALAPDDWARGRGWALWKALVVLAGLAGNDPADADSARITLCEVLEDHAAHR